MLQPLLSSISAHEFRTGCIEQARWKTFRESLASEPRHLLPASPKIAALVEQTAWTTSFANRGPVDTAESFSLVISTHPQDFLFMSNGRDWRSCQHFSTGCENHQLPGNFYDTNVAVALVLLPNTSVGEEESVLVRTTLRIFLHQEQPLVTIGRTYHNNETLALLLLCKLAEIFDIRGLSWGFICGINALAYCQDDFLGPALSQRLEANIQLGSVPFCLPRGWYTPYIDKGSHRWERDYAFESDDYSRRWLNADVRPMRPAHSQSHTQVQDDQPASIRALPLA